MAQKEQLTQRKQELVKQLAENRRAIQQGCVDIKAKFQVKQLLQQFVFSKPKSLFAGSAIAGLGAAMLLKKPKRAAARTTRAVLFGWILALIKPAARTWLLSFAKQWASQRLLNPQVPQAPQATHSPRPHPRL